MLTNVPVLIQAVFSIVREVRTALDADGSGGKKITREEWGRILDTATETFKGVLSILFPAPTK